MHRKKEKTLKNARVKKKEKLIQDEDLDKVSGGSALDDMPVVDEHDYDDDTREKINP